MSKQSIRQPSHTKLVLSTAIATVEGNGAVFLTPTNQTRLGGVALDANDAVRLAAFLNRFYTEQNQTAQRNQAQAERRAAAARAVK